MDATPRMMLLWSSCCYACFLSLLIAFWHAPKSGEGLWIAPRPSWDVVATGGKHRNDGRTGGSVKVLRQRGLGSATSHGLRSNKDSDPTEPGLISGSCPCRINSPPVIGVFSQPVKAAAPGNANKNSATASADGFPHYIAASYIKWLEAGGARTIAIPYDASTTVLDTLFEQIHMVFLPGGDALLSSSVRYLLNKVHDSNQNGNGFPVWGTCLGMEFLLSHFGQDGEPLEESYDAENMSLPLLDVQVVESPEERTSSQQRRHSLYDDPTVYRIVTTQSVTLNNHKKGMSPQVFQSNRNLTDLWHVTSTNLDKNNRSFVSTIEPIHPDVFPYYGVQYHPEKNMFEYAFYDRTTVPYEVIAHTPDAIEFSFRIARFAVDLAQRSRLRRCARASGHENSDQPIYRHEYTDPIRFPPTYTYPTRSGINFEQVFMIPPSSSSAASTTTATARDEAVDESNAGVTSLSALQQQSRSQQGHGAPPVDGRSVMQW